VAKPGDVRLFYLQKNIDRKTLNKGCLK
jgi:hypothetical protein